MSFTTLKPVRATVPIFAPVAPVKLDPVIVIAVDAREFDGVKLDTTGAATVNDTPVEVPPGPVTVMFPVFAVVGFVDLMSESLTTVNPVIETVPIFTAVAPVKLDPLIEIGVPIRPVEGVIDEIVESAGRVTLKFVGLTQTP